MERGVLILRDFFYLPIQFGCRCLVDAAGFGHAQLADSFQDAQYAHGIYICGELWRVETYLHMALCGKVVDFIRTHSADYAQDTHRVAKVGIVQMEMGESLQMSDALTEIYGRTANGTVHVISFLEQQFRQIRSVLSGNACNKCCFLHCMSFESNCFLPIIAQRYKL